jgi:hypothetical protein
VGRFKILKHLQYFYKILKPSSTTLSFKIQKGFLDSTSKFPGLNLSAPHPWRIWIQYKPAAHRIKFNFTVRTPNPHGSVNYIATKALFPACAVRGGSPARIIDFYINFLLSACLTAALEYFLYPCHAIREPNRVISGLEMRIDMEIRSIRTSIRTGTDTLDL